ncbi:hypothetical protein FA95DRAFT_1127654 [Auriscalpium vulgare]|uniref:Uncharacterized protein n=1 Tax=Auriscalpium vulgare TaxID=40419 RepID=A0ACB8R4U7_9AGAM|nr:hypothetical protein FA95DRAFT_1127654 [Auriscalpium vulgare]
MYAAHVVVTLIVCARGTRHGSERTPRAFGLEASASKKTTMGARHLLVDTMHGDGGHISVPKERHARPATQRKVKPPDLVRAQARSTSASHVRARQRPRYSDAEEAASPGDGVCEDDDTGRGPARCWRRARGVVTRRAARPQCPRTVCCVRLSGWGQAYARRRARGWPRSTGESAKAQHPRSAVRSARRGGGRGGA